LLNIPFCRKVLDFAVEEHEGFWHDQCTFYAQHVVCGTRACVAGIANMLSPDVEIVKIEYPAATLMSCKGSLLTYSLSHLPEVDGELQSWDYSAQQLMGLTSKQADALFWESLTNQSAIDRLRRYIEEAEHDEYLKGLLAR
jgi:hypothetical protein